MDYQEQQTPSNSSPNKDSVNQQIKLIQDLLELPRCHQVPNNHQLSLLSAQSSQGPELESQYSQTLNILQGHNPQIQIAYFNHMGLILEDDKRDEYNKQMLQQVLEEEQNENHSYCYRFIESSHNCYNKSQGEFSIGSLDEQLFSSSNIIQQNNNRLPENSENKGEFIRQSQKKERGRKNNEKKRKRKFSSDSGSEYNPSKKHMKKNRKKLKKFNSMDAELFETNEHKRKCSMPTSQNKTNQYCEHGLSITDCANCHNI